MNATTFPVSDLGLVHRVQMAMNQKDQRLTSVVVDATGPEIVHLSGRVRSFHLRQLAVSTARHVAGVRHVSDGIQVPPPVVVRKPH